MRSVTVTLFIALCMILFGNDYATGQGGFSHIYSVGPFDHISDPNSPYSYHSIQDAIDACVDGDKVEVYDGTFREYTYTECIDFDGKDIIVISVQGNSITIDGNQVGSVVTFSQGETQLARLEGFTITNGYATDGGGIYIKGTYQTKTSPTIKDCTIIDNEAVDNGGGIALIMSNSEIKNCTIKQNLCGQWGGGIFDTGEDKSPTIDDCIIKDNTATGPACGAGGGVMVVNGGMYKDCQISSNWACQGAGMYGVPQDGGKALNIEDCDIYHNGDIDTTYTGGGIHIIGHDEHGSCHFKIDSNKIYENYANEGGGVYFITVLYVPTYSDFINNIIYENEAEKGGAFFGEGTMNYKAFNNTCADNEADYGAGCYADSNDTVITFVNCIFWDDQTNGEMAGSGDIYATYSDIYMTSGVYGDPLLDYNINEDPDFTSPGLDRYTIVYGSPCINSGTGTGAPDHDFEGDARPYPNPGYHDMGADEYVP